MSNVMQDLCFKSVENPFPKLLMPEQLDRYNREGFLAPFDIFTPQEARFNLQYFDELLAQAGEQEAYAINCYQARLRGIWDLCNEPRILDLVQDLIGPNIVCWASHYFCKMPLDERAVPWHQDAAYWQLSPARTVTVWLAIDDADEENAAMQFMPGTHNRGLLEVKKPEGPSVLRLEAVGAGDLGEPVSNHLKAGQVSLHADMLLHSSRPNLSQRRRCGLTIRYCPPEVAITDPVWAKGVEAIICRGKDPAGRWTHHERPGNNTFDVSKGPISVGGN